MIGHKNRADATYLHGNEFRDVCTASLTRARVVANWRSAHGQSLSQVS